MAVLFDKQMTGEDLKAENDATARAVLLHSHTDCAFAFLSTLEFSISASVFLFYRVDESYHKIVNLSYVSQFVWL